LRGKTSTVGEVTFLIEATTTQASAQQQESLGNLPVQLTRLVGRDAALQELHSLLWRTRVLTLCGPGGSGKTRLAVALAHAMRPDFVGGAWWVDLSTTVEDRLVPQVVWAAVSQGDLTSDPAPAAFARMFPEPSLLVLDNCEQVADGCAELTVALLQASDSLKVIATSRRPLGVPGEHVWRVGGLAVPEPEPTGAREGLDDGAESLFIERAREASSAFDPDAPGVRDSIGRICRWLDGMPLAIELAAARVPVLSVEQIADRLERDSSVLRHPARRAPERHRTLTSMLEWSHRMLEPAERRLFRQLAVFRGTFSLAAAEYACAGEASDAADVLDLLAALIDRSLVQVVDNQPEPRYRLLSTVLHYAAAKLSEDPRGAAVYARHAEYFLSLAASAQAGLAGQEQARWLERMQIEHDNLTAALEWLSRESLDEAAHMSRLLWPFWYQRGYYREARMRFERLLSREAEMSPARRADVLLGAGEVAFLQCDYATAADHLNTAFELVRELGDARTTATVLQRLGSIAREQARYQEARDLHRRSLAIWEELGDASGVATSRDYLGFVAWLSGDPQAGEKDCAAALAAFKAAGDLRATATALVNLGACALNSGALELAGERLEEAHEIASRLGFQEGIAWSLHELAIAGRRARRPSSETAPMLREALLIHRRLGDRWRVASVLEEIAGSALLRSDPERAVQVMAAADALRKRIGTPVPPAEELDRDAAVTQLRRRLGSGNFAAAWSAGAGTELDGMIDEAVAGIDALADSDRFFPAADLTPRERAVLELLVEGHTNREIAATLFISPSTAGVHVSNILRKLGAKRRVDAAAIAHKAGLLSPR
jgi:predicted ATPase/DNA-binding CsgD family transcriptional regulator